LRRQAPPLSSPASRVARNHRSDIAAPSLVASVALAAALVASPGTAATQSSAPKTTAGLTSKALRAELTRKPQKTKARPGRGRHRSHPRRDRKAPSAPRKVRVTQVGQSTLTLAWQRSSDNVRVAGYRVYRNKTLAGRTIGLRFVIPGLRQDPLSSLGSGSRRCGQCLGQGDRVAVDEGLQAASTSSSTAAVVV
jgi:hypothetical protein